MNETTVRFDATPAVVRFRVRGLPIAQGSAKAFIRGNRAIIATGASKGPLGAWRHAVADRASLAFGETTPVMEGPVTVTIAFYLPRPGAHFHPANSRRPERVLRDDAPSWHTGKPDSDKLARSVLDAITAVVVRDDSQVAALHVRKLYEQTDHPVGASIAVEQL